MKMSDGGAWIGSFGEPDIVGGRRIPVRHAGSRFDPFDAGEPAKRAEVGRGVQRLQQNRARIVQAANRRDGVVHELAAAVSIAVLPAPFGPMTPYNAPAGTTRSRSWMAIADPNVFRTWSSRSAPHA